MAAAPYWELAIAVTPESAEALTNFLWEQGALGVVEEAPAGESPRLRAFFSGQAAAGELEHRVRAYVASLTRLGVPAPGPPSLVPLEDGHWAEAWREHFRPLRIGRRLVVAPPWEVPAADATCITVVIEPARAFGTGHHGSTAGCLERLEATVEDSRPAAALDLGCGSGILAIAAVRLGVARVLAVDDDPDAVAATSCNATVNGVAEQVRAILADAADLEVAPVPLVLANLLAAAHLRLAPRYAAYLAPGGILIAGGLLDAEAEGVVAALAPQGFVRASHVSIDGWTTLAMRRAAR
jgi:ribosomal protein L11 methyltransferase